jgi:regulator of sigma E protease
MLITIIVFILILGLLIFAHEFGHFITAKLNNVKVEEFAFGFPPRLFSIRRGGTRYSINAIPIGGYVKILGEEESNHEAGSLQNKKISVKMLIIVAGVLMNFLLAIFLMTIGFSIGMTPLVSDPAKMTGTKVSQVMVVYIQPGSPAAKIGLEPGNIINGFNSTSDLQTFTHEHLGQEVDLSVLKNQTTENIKVTLSEDQTAPLGVGLIPITKVKQPFYQAFITSFTEAGKAVGAIFVFLWTIIKNVFTTGHAGQAAEGVVGPVGLFNFTAQAIKIGWIYVLQLVIILSINLGVINILHFPALDGGKALFLGLEGIFRRKIIRTEVENIIHLIGFGLLILLLIAITYRDIINYF